MATHDRSKHGDIARLELLGVEDLDLLLVHEDDEDGVSHEVHLVDHLVGAVEAVKLERLGVIIYVEKLDDFVPCNGHKR